MTYHSNDTEPLKLNNHGAELYCFYIEMVLYCIAILRNGNWVNTENTFIDSPSGHPECIKAVYIYTLSAVYAVDTMQSSLTTHL